ncbi:sodium/glutamate symporter [uncultured Mitsuokella sp.]|uniref:sodium/glutamate symporter n=1 Tax=uncultured Mitsuokella sp. TaxID=453120 RepID=UPI0025F78993|nr:sodium/glutamate symporter [uncultured Mitsuokella sp.]
MNVNLNIYQTLAAAVAVYYVGVLLRIKVPFLRKYCIPAPVVGGILFAVINDILYVNGIWTYKQDTIMQNVCMMLFFTSIGYTASISLIKKGGSLVAKMAVLTAILIVCQNIIGISLAHVFDLSPLMGLATGSIPMVGGHGTSGSFGPVLESVGLDNATTIAFAAATFGLVSGSLLGGPMGELLVRRNHLFSIADEERLDPENSQDEVQKLEQAAHGERKAIDEEKRTGQSINNYRFMNALAHLLLAMGLGTVVSQFFSSIGLIFPGYIGSMLVAAIIRNVADYTHVYKVYQRESEVLGNLGLTIFLSCALMSLKLWQLSDLAIPLMAMLASQVLFIALFVRFVLFRVMGSNYEAAVMAAGTCGFGLGATPNAIANMSVMVERFGPAPTAFFVIPIIGALIVDFVNSSIVTVLINFLA